MENITFHNNIVIQTGGEILSCSVIPEIEYHAILATIPREYAQKIIDREDNLWGTLSI